MLEVYTEDYFMKQALVEAKRALAEGEVPVGAVVVCNNQIVARAYNQTERLNDSTAHAEMLALTAASNHIGSKYLDQCTLYVTLEPCVMCIGATYWSQLKGIVYGASDEKRGFSFKQDSLAHPKTIIKKGVMADEAIDLMQQFFSKIRNK